MVDSLIPLILNWRWPPALLIIFANLGIMVSAPFIAMDGVHRAFSSTVVDIAQFAIAFSFAVFVIGNFVIMNFALLNSLQQKRRDFLLGDQ